MLLTCLGSRLQLLAASLPVISKRTIPESGLLVANTEVPDKVTAADEVL